MCYRQKNMKQKYNHTVEQTRLSPKRHLKCAANFKEMLTYVLSYKTEVMSQSNVANVYPQYYAFSLFRSICSSLFFVLFSIILFYFILFCYKSVGNSK